MSAPTVTPPDIHAVHNTALNLAPGVSLTALQRRHVGVVLDLFQARGTMAKLVDNLTEDAVYEDLFATCKNRTEVAGQFLGLPLVTKSSQTVFHQVTSVQPTTGTTTRGNGSPIHADEIHITTHQRFDFKLVGVVEMHTVLIVFSDSAEGKIVRIQDRPMGEIPGNSILTALRKLNAVVAPSMVGMPADEKEDAEKVLKHQR